MPIQELYSKTKKRQLNKDQPVVLHYDHIPDEFRNQVFLIWKNAIGPYGKYFSGRVVWDEIHEYLCRELNLPTLGPSTNLADNCIQFLFQEATDHVLDIIQVSFNAVEHQFEKYNGNPDWMEHQTGLSYPPDIAIKELNTRFLENNIGFQYLNGRIVRIDSQYTHAEIVEPALQLLNEAPFKPALDEFLKAQEAYRRGRYEEAMNEALKAFESTIKIIVENKKWASGPNLTTVRLIQICFDHHLIPAPFQSRFAGLKTGLESSLPSAGKQSSAHGDETEYTNIPSYIAQYTLNLAATNIVLLIKAYNAQNLASG